jgi:S1-C subfamily serine protease
MKKLFAVLATVLTLVASSASAWTYGEMNKTIDSSNFIVNRGCSGTLISTEYRLILTNHHCIEGSSKIVTKDVTDYDGVVTKKQFEEMRDIDVSQRRYEGHQILGESIYKAQVVARWKASDLALLQIRADIQNQISAPVYAGNRVYRGEGVYVVGNPLGLDATVTRGIISSTTRMFYAPWAGAEVSFIQIDAGISAGNSGGSLFNDVGQLIGVPAAGVPSNTQLGLAIPFFRIQEFLTDNCYGSVWDRSQPSFEVCTADVYEDAY